MGVGLIGPNHGCGNRAKRMWRVLGLPMHKSTKTLTSRTSGRREGTQYNVLMEELGETYYYDALLDLHQTYEQEEYYDTFVQYADADWMPQAQQEYATAWGEAIEAAFGKIGAHFSGVRTGGDERWIIHQFSIKYGTPQFAL